MQHEQHTYINHKRPDVFTFLSVVWFRSHSVVLHAAHTSLKRGIDPGWSLCSPLFFDDAKLLSVFRL